MGWGRMSLLGNVGQQLDISDLGNEVGRMQSAFASNQNLDREQASAIKRLQAENEELKLYLATLLKLLVSKGALRADEVETTVRTIETEP